MTELKIGGQSFDARVRESGDMLYCYYDSEFEEQFENHNALLNALENHVLAQVESAEDKTIRFRADASY